MQGLSLYPASFVGHHLQGAAAAMAVLYGDTKAMVLALLWSFFYVKYQEFTQKRKGDSAGLDVLDYIVGIAIGIAWYLAVLEFGLGLPF